MPIAPALPNTHIHWCLVQNLQQTKFVSFESHNNVCNSKFIYTFFLQKDITYWRQKISRT